MKTYSAFQQLFETYFSANEESIRVFFAPGRVNIMGEHIDYNGGLVLPAGITQGVYIMARKRCDDKIHIQSLFSTLPKIINIHDPLQYDEKDDWLNYPKGIFQLLKEKYNCITALDILIYSDLPTASGLSSSAALELALAYTMWHMNGSNIPLDLLTLAVDCQRVENNFIGVQCGIMDQAAIALAQKDKALLLNCTTLTFKHIPFSLGAYTLVIMNTNKPRSLIHSAFNERRSQCENALQLLQNKWDIQNLCEAIEEQLEILSDPVLFKRAKHVITENDRVLKMCNFLENGDMIQAGKILNQSHLSLKDDYEVSCDELDELVFWAQKNIHCVGARMTGAGFGGCAIAFVESEHYISFVNSVSEKYNVKFLIPATFYKAEISAGLRELFINDYL